MKWTRNTDSLSKFCVRFQTDTYSACTLHGYCAKNQIFVWAEDTSLDRAIFRILKLLTSLNTRKNIKGLAISKWSSQPKEKVDGLNATDDGEPSEEPHGASNETQLGLKLDLLVSLDVVKSCRVKVDLHQLKSWL